MASDLLGEAVDINSGGVDLQFPHHENQIAQARGDGLWPGRSGDSCCSVAATVSTLKRICAEILLIMHIMQHIV